MAAPTFGAVTVLIADTGSGRAMLADLLSEFDDFQVVAVASDAEQAIDLAALHNPQVALLHVDVAGGGGAHATRVLFACHRDTQPETEPRLARTAVAQKAARRPQPARGARPHLPTPRGGRHPPPPLPPE